MKAKLDSLRHEELRNGIWRLLAGQVSMAIVLGIIIAIICCSGCGQLDSIMPRIDIPMSP